MRDRPSLRARPAHGPVPGATPSRARSRPPAANTAGPAPVADAPLATLGHHPRTAAAVPGTARRQARARSGSDVGPRGRDPKETAVQDPAPRPGETLAGRDPLVVVERLLRQAEGPLVAPADPHDALDAPGRRERALEALLREEPEDAAAHARAGLDAAGGGDPAVRLGLLRLLATAAAHARDAAGLERWTTERADLLHSLGRPRQAELEVQL